MRGTDRGSAHFRKYVLMFVSTEEAFKEPFQVPLKNGLRKEIKKKLCRTIWLSAVEQLGVTKSLFQTQNPF